MISIHFIAVMVLVVIGTSAVVFRKNMIKIVMGTAVMSSGANLFLVSLGYREGGIAPIFTAATQLEMVLPTPQALTLTSIVINLAVTALMLSFVILMYNRSKSLDIRDRRLKG